MSYEEVVVGSRCNKSRASPKVSEVLDTAVVRLLLLRWEVASSCSHLVSILLHLFFSSTFLYLIPGLSSVWFSHTPCFW